MNEERINLLAKKWLDGTLTAAERQEFEQWYAAFDDSEETLDRETPEDLGKRMYQHIIAQRQSPPRNITRMSPRRWAAAAAVLLSLSFSAYLLLRPMEKGAPAITMQQTGPGEDLEPGGNRATLMLGDGSIVSLDDMEEGALKEQQGARFIKLDSGSLAYTSAQQTDKVSYNTLTTPRGGQFKLMLPDSSMVYLNAASSVTFLTAFPADERRVVVTGEAYFEVKPDRKRPFRVVTSSATGEGQLIEVLGTHFNVNAYADEAAVTTSLLEGSVKIIPMNGNSETETKAEVLKPGQQSLWQNGALRVQEADVFGAVAWKNGLFQFRDASLPEVMRQLSRWYDVDIVYEGEVPERTFSGKMYRNINASQALELLKFMKVNFRIEGKKIIVTP